MLRRVSFSVFGCLTVALLVLSACGGGVATQPPATQPPATEPPTTELPATQPPATEPPATQPPATEPPVTEVPSFAFSLPVAQIVSITYSPAKFMVDDTLSFTINYGNSSSDMDLNETMLEVDYDPSQLIYLDSSPAESSSESGHLSWNLDILNPQAGSAITVNFIVAQIPSQLSLDTKINGKISQETSSNDSRRILIYPDQEAESVYPKAEVYPEGVYVYLPEQNEQNSGKELHSERRAYDVSMQILPEAAEIYSIIRPITYIDIFDENQELVSAFSPAITLTIDYTDKDSAEAGEADNLIILLYDSDINAWIPCDGEFGNPDKTVCGTTERVIITENTGFLRVSVTQWTSGTGLGKR